MQSLDPLSAILLVKLELVYVDELLLMMQPLKWVLVS